MCVSLCLIVPDIPVFVLHCVTHGFEASFTSGRSRRILHTAVPQRRALLCLLLPLCLPSPKPRFYFTITFRSFIARILSHLCEFRALTRRRPCAAALFKRLSTQSDGRGPSRALLQRFPYGRRGERVVFPPARFIGPILMSLGVAD